MKEWKKVKLGEYIITNPNNINKDYSFSTIFYLDTGSITSNKISELQLMPLDKSPSRAKRLVKDGDIIYSTVRPNQLHYGYLKNTPKNLVVSTGFIVIRTLDLINSKFLYYYLIQASLTKYLHSIAEGSVSTYPSIKPNDIEDLKISLPPLKEQKAIAEVLSNLDDKIELLQKQNETLEQLAETLFRQWFIEEAEEDWEEQTLGDVINLYDFKRIPLSKIERSKMKDGQLYPYYGAATIMDYVNSYIFEGDYILMAEDGSVQTEEGYPVLQYARGKFWVNNHAHILTGISPYSNSFIWMFLKTKNIQQYITGAVQPKLNQKNLKSITFPKYPQSRVFYYTKIVSPYFDKIESNQLQIQTLTEMRDTLLPKLMSGEVRVKLAD